MPTAATTYQLTGEKYKFKPKKINPSASHAILEKYKITQEKNMIVKENPYSA